MQQRDIIKDEIEQVGKVIGKIIGDYLGNKSYGNIIDVINQTNQSLKSELNIDINKILVFEKKDLIKYISELNLAGSHLDKLVKYLYDVGKSQNKVSIEDNDDSRSYLNAALTLLNIAEEKSKTFTFERENLKNNIKTSLDKL